MINIDSLFFSRGLLKRIRYRTSFNCCWGSCWFIVELTCITFWFNAHWPPRVQCVRPIFWTTSCKIKLYFFISWEKMSLNITNLAHILNLNLTNFLRSWLRYWMLHFNYIYFRRLGRVGFNRLPLTSVYLMLLHDSPWRFLLHLNIKQLDSFFCLSWIDYKLRWVMSHLYHSPSSCSNTFFAFLFWPWNQSFSTLFFSLHFSFNRIDQIGSLIVFFALVLI